MNRILSNLLGDPFWLVTIAVAVVGWCIAFVGSIINNIQEPKRFPIFGWWGLGWQFLINGLVIYSVLTNRMYMYRHALTAFLGLAAVYSTNSTNNFVWRSTSTCGTVAAGQILLSIVDIVWIFFIGTTHDEPVHSYVASFASTKHSTTNQDYRRRQYAPRPNGNGATGYSRDFGNDRSSSYSPALRAGGSQAYPNMFTSDNVHLFEDQRSTQRSERPLSVLSGSTDQSDSLSLPSEYPYKARTLYSYTANPEDDNEISFEKDEVLEISDITGRWWQARRANGEVGICPSNYVVLL